MSSIQENTPRSCWVVTEGIAGTENQCLGLAEALGLRPHVKRVGLAKPWKLISPYIRVGKAALTGDLLAPPWPDLVIASGRKAVEAALYIKKQSRGKSFIVQVQDPRISPRHFDLVVAPQHDPVRGENVLLTTGSLHRVTTEKLHGEAAKFPALNDLPHPRVAVLIGGTSKAHQMSAPVVGQLIDQLKKLSSQGAQLLITASRRTGAENRKRLMTELSPHAALFWDGLGENPYFAFLAQADYILVTEDSVSMTSESISTGKPVLVIKLEGGSKRINRFHALLQQQGFTRPFTGKLETWSYTPPCDTQAAAAETMKRFKLRKTT